MLNKSKQIVEKEKQIYGFYDGFAYDPPSLTYIGYDKQLFDLLVYRYTFSQYFEELSLEKLVECEFHVSGDPKNIHISYENLKELLAFHNIPTIQNEEETYVNIEEISKMEEKYDDAIQKICDIFRLVEYYVEPVSLDDINNQDVTIMTKAIKETENVK